MCIRCWLYLLVYWELGVAVGPDEHVTSLLGTKSGTRLIGTGGLLLPHTGRERLMPDEEPEVSGPTK